MSSSWSTRRALASDCQDHRKVLGSTAAHQEDQQCGGDCGKPNLREDHPADHSSYDERCERHCVSREPLTSGRSGPRWPVLVELPVHLVRHLRGSSRGVVNEVAGARDGAQAETRPSVHLIENLLLGWREEHAAQSPSEEPDHVRGARRPAPAAVGPRATDRSYSALTAKSGVTSPGHWLIATAYAAQPRGGSWLRYTRMVHLQSGRDTLCKGAGSD